MNRLALVMQRRTARFAAALLSGALLVVSLGLTPFWPAAWLAPIPLLLASFYADAREARYLAWLAAAIGLSPIIGYYQKVTGLPWAAVLVLLQVLMWGFLTAQTRISVLKSTHWTTTYLFPTLFAAVDTLVAYFSPHGTWSSFAYTQMDALPVIQIAAILGAPAIVFTVALFASSIAIAIYRGRALERPWLALGAPLAIVGMVVAFGAGRLAMGTRHETIRVGVAAIDAYVGVRTPSAKGDEVWSGYDSLVSGLAHAGAKVIVLPEKIAVLDSTDIARRESGLAAIAARNDVYLVVGVQLNRSSREDNAAWLFGPDGNTLAEYRKQKLVPGLEHELTAGHEDVVRRIDGNLWGLAICRDLLFTDLGRRYGRLGISGVLVPAWDFGTDAWMESAAADLRGVESGYAVVRAGRESFLNISDRYGHVVARVRSTALPGSSVLADLPLGPPAPTIYARCGDVFGWFCVILIVLRRLGYGRMRLRRPAKATQIGMASRY